MKLLPDLLSFAASHYPDHTLIEGDRKTTYKTLEKKVNALSAFLISESIKKGDPVAIYLPNSIEFAISFFGVTRIGAIAVPINPSYKLEELKYYISNSLSKIVLTDKTLEPLVLKSIEGLDTKLIVIRGGNLNLDEEMFVDIDSLDEDLEAIYLYSTGSTGKPKRVSRTHKNLIALAENHTSTVNWTAGDSLLFVVPVSHTYGFGNFISAVRVGAYIIFQDGFNRRKVIEVLDKYKVNVFPAVPFMIDMLSKTRVEESLDISSLHFVLSAGAPLSRESFFGFKEKFGVYPRQLYGSSETGVISINVGEDIEKRYNSVGKPVQNVEVRIVDGMGEDCPANSVGEIIVRSRSMTTGYHNLPEETAKAFKKGYYYTGDLGKFDDEGYIYIVGRKKLFINISGNKIDPIEVERVIISNDKIDEAVVIGINDNRGGEYVKAIVVQRNEISTRELMEFCRDRLAGFKIPKIIEFRDSLPKSPTGKILRNKL